MSEPPIPKAPSVFSRFRLAGISVILGIGLVGGIFYGLLNNHYLGMILGQTLGPYSDTLSQHILATPEPDFVRRVAMSHRLTILLEPVDGESFAFDKEGQEIPLDSPKLQTTQIKAIRSSVDGTRVTLHWTVWSFRQTHFPMLSGMVILIVAVVGTAFWFLQRQLKPLAWLHNGVEAVSGGDFTTRVPIVRNDEIGQVATAFNEMAGRVGEMIDDRERLLADVSHELRSPIARMKVALEFMPEGAKRDLLARDLREMESLISALLEREKLRSEGGRRESQDVDPNTIVADVVAALADQAPGVEFNAGPSTTLRADPALIKLLVQNLIDNALKFSRPDSAPVVVTCEAGESELTLRVADDGIGIPAGTEEQLFEPFVKSDRSRGHHVGYGLGLNLCQRVVQLYDGTIHLERREPRGTVAVVSLPIEESRRR